MRTVLEAASAGSEEAQLGVDVYVHRLRAGIAAMAAAMDGLDALVFTGGVGENAAPIRARAVAGLAFLNVSLNLEANAEPEFDADITGLRSQVKTFVIAAREDLQIARDVHRVLGY
jgi:acetate kinase